MSATNSNSTESEWPWEVDESKRYPPKDPAVLTDFERRYPPDPVGQELGDNARIWRVYHDRMNAIDEDTISAWNDSINFLLVFSGLFSAVLTAFVIESSKQLERDPSETATELLVALVSHFNGSSIPPRSQLPIDHFTAPASARIVNAFWFFSLSLALVVSMFAILAKQWITMFWSRMRAPATNLRRWAHRHCVFKDGIERWHLNAFVSSLSVALHAAVLLFMSGLIVHLSSRDSIIFYLVLGITALAVGIYVAATVAPLFDGTCPTATPLLIHSHQAYVAVRQAIRRFFGGPTSDTESGYHSSRNDKPSFDPEVILVDENAPQRDSRSLVHIYSVLPDGHDRDVVLDAIGALVPGQHDLGESHAELRRATRQRLEAFSRSAGIATSDPAAIARALRSSIYIESRPKPVYWEDFVTFRVGLMPIRTHDIFALLTTLYMRVQLNAQHSMQREKQEQRAQRMMDEVQRLERRLERDGERATQHVREELKKLQKRQRQRLLLEQRLNEQRLQRVPELLLLQIRQQTQQQAQQPRRPKRLENLEQQELLGKEEQLRLLQLTVLGPAFCAVEAIARWKLEAPPASQQPVSPQLIQSHFNGILEFITAASTSQSFKLELEICASIVIGFGGDFSISEPCNKLITPMAIAALERERTSRGHIAGSLTWSPLPESIDWRLRAINLWAQVASSYANVGPSTLLADKVYSYILTQWSDEASWPSLDTVSQLRSIVLPSGRPNLPATARATLWKIVRPTLENAQTATTLPGIVHDILHGVSMDEMVIVCPTIVESTFGFGYQRQDQGNRGHCCTMSYEYFSAAYRHLLGLMQPISTTASGLGNTWQTIRSYLTALPDDEHLAKITAESATILAIHALMSGNAGLLEQFLRGGIGRRVILSHEQRLSALSVAQQAYLVATTWWDEMRDELLQTNPIVCTGTATEDFEDVASFVRTVEDAEVCPDCIQKGCAWIPRLEEEEKTYDAWIQHVEPGWAAEPGQDIDTNI